MLDQIKSELLRHHSKEMRIKVVRLISGNQKNFDALMRCVTDKENPVLRQRASWPLGFCLEHHPELGAKHVDLLIKLMQDNELHQSMRRNVTRAFLHMEIPEKHHGLLIDQCFRYLEDPKELPAVKANSIGILNKLRMIYPDITQEFKQVLETLYENESPAFKARARKILSKI